MKIAAVVYSQGSAGRVDDLLSGIAGDLRAEGFRLAGAVQRNVPRAASACAHMLLEDLAIGKPFPISVQERPSADSCSLDPAALEDAVGFVAASLGRDVDLLVINRFGKQEALGHGFRSVIESGVAEGIPVLCGLNQAFRPEWQAFTEGQSIELPVDRAAIWNWCHIACRATSTISATP